MLSSEQLEEAAQQEIARRHLIDFACYVDPAAARQYHARHLAKIAAQLEAVERGNCTRLMITMPPRHWKSSLTSEKFTAWYLGRHPKRSIIIASYAVSLPLKFSRTVRELIRDSLRYRGVFRDVSLKLGSESIEDWSLAAAHRSSFRAVGVGGGVTGHGANLIIIDDPVENDAQARSETYRENAWQWYKQTLRTRAEPGAAIVLIMTRWHEDDLAGKLLKAEREEGGEHWQVLNLPAVDATGMPLWPERFDAESLSATRSAIGEYAWQCLYQGQPTQAEGHEIKREWFEFVPQLPAGVREQCRAVDTAMTIKETLKSDPDYTASIGGAMAGGWLYLTEPFKFRAEIPDVINRIRDWKKLHPFVRIGTAHSFSDNSARKGLQNEGIALEEYEEKGDIKTRCAVAINWASRGLVKLVVRDSAQYEHYKLDGTVPAEWEQFLAELLAAFTGAHDDYLAALAGLTQMFGLVIPAPVVREPVVARGPVTFGWGKK